MLFENDSVALVFNAGIEAGFCLTFFVLKILFIFLSQKSNSFFYIFEKIKI